jgi:hypothetical protein
MIEPGDNDMESSLYKVWELVDGNVLHGRRKTQGLGREHTAEQYFREVRFAFRCLVEQKSDDVHLYAAVRRLPAHFQCGGFSEKLPQNTRNLTR